MKNVKTGILILLCMLVLVGCAVKKPEAAVKKLLNSIKNLDAEAISDCFVPAKREEITDALSELQSENGELQDTFLGFIKDNAHKMTYELSTHNSIWIKPL